LGKNVPKVFTFLFKRKTMPTLLNDNNASTFERYQSFIDRGIDAMSEFSSCSVIIETCYAKICMYWGTSNLYVNLLISF